MQNVTALIAEIANDEMYFDEVDVVVRNSMLDKYVEWHYVALTGYYETDDECEIFEALKEDVDIAAGICIVLT
jgi:hypothetical protein